MLDQLCFVPVFFSVLLPTLWLSQGVTLQQIPTRLKQVRPVHLNEVECVLNELSGVLNELSGVLIYIAFCFRITSVFYQQTIRFEQSHDSHMTKLI